MQALSQADVDKYGTLSLDDIKESLKGKVSFERAQEVRDQIIDLFVKATPPPKSADILAGAVLLIMSLLVAAETLAKSEVPN